VPIEVGGETRRIGLTRLHLEEDAGKSIHEGLPDADRFSHVDLNRAGVPLLEIVSRPDLRDPAEAYAFLQRLRSVLRYTGVCNGNLEEGSLRCDANVSIRPRGSTGLGPRTELKNLNSFRNVQRALEYEIGRQVEVLSRGGRIGQETALWDASAGVTRPMRDKEEAEDYRYFPEPDLPPLVLDRSWIEALRGRLGELPDALKRRLAAQHGLGEEEAHRLTLQAPLARFFEEVARASGNPRAAANFVLNDLLRAQNEAQHDEGDVRMSAAHLAQLIRLVDEGIVSASVARQELFPEMYRTGAAPADLVRRRGLEQVRDEEELARLVREVLARHEDHVASYRAGKRGLLGYFVGQVMRQSGGKADPRRVAALLEEELG
jgi:aspartyl-tRNA(Asn)/glutamyl-tRNA(Gln) amidotransferase subunit B